MQKPPAKILRIVILATLLLNLPVLYPSEINAHTLTTDGTIGAVLHIDPEDDPIAGEPAYFFFDIKDRDNKFKSDNCNCIVTIEKNGTQIYQGELFANPVFTFTFPEKDIYKVILTGTPKNDSAFSEFSISSDIRVERISQTPVTSSATAESTPPGSSRPVPSTTNSPNWFIRHNIHFIGGGVIAVIFLYLLIRQGRFKRK